MVKRSLALAISLLSAWATPATAVPDFESGNTWLELCQSKDTGAQGSCTWFVYGFSQGITAQAVGSGKQKIYCQPESVTYGQARDIRVKFMVDNPAERHRPAGVLLMISLIKAFPCSDGKK